MQEPRGRQVSPHTCVVDEITWAGMPGKPGHILTSSFSRQSDFDDRVIGLLESMRLVSFCGQVRGLALASADCLYVRTTE